MSVKGLMSTVILTELINALRADGIHVPDTVGPNTSKYIRSLANDLVEGARLEEEKEPFDLKRKQSDNNVCKECGGNWLVQISDTLFECQDCEAMLRIE